MTGEIVRPISLPTSREARQRRSGRTVGHRRLTMPPLPALPERLTVHGFTSIDVRGRLAVPGLLKVLGWEPGTVLEVGRKGGLVLLTVGPNGTQRVTARWHVSLPAQVRHWHGLAAGTRLLLVAEPAEARLVVHTPAALDAMIVRMHREVLGGGGA